MSNLLTLSDNEIDPIYDWTPIKQIKKRVACELPVPNQNAESSAYSTNIAQTKSESSEENLEESKETEEEIMPESFKVPDYFLFKMNLGNYGDDNFPLTNFCISEFMKLTNLDQLIDQHMINLKRERYKGIEECYVRFLLKSPKRRITFPGTSLKFKDQEAEQKINTLLMNPKIHDNLKYEEYKNFLESSNLKDCRIDMTKNNPVLDSVRNFTKTKNENDIIKYQNSFELVILRDYYQKVGQKTKFLCEMSLNEFCDITNFENLVETQMKKDGTPSTNFYKSLTEHFERLKKHPKLRWTEFFRNFVVDPKYIINFNMINESQEKFLCKTMRHLKNGSNLLRLVELQYPGESQQFYHDKCFELFTLYKNNPGKRKEGIFMNLVIDSTAYRTGNVDDVAKKGNSNVHKKVNGNENVPSNKLLESVKNQEILSSNSETKNSGIEKKQTNKQNVVGKETVELNSKLQNPSFEEKSNNIVDKPKVISFQHYLLTSAPLPSSQNSGSSEHTTSSSSTSTNDTVIHLPNKKMGIQEYENFAGKNKRIRLCSPKRNETLLEPKKLQSNVEAAEIIEIDDSSNQSRLNFQESDTNSPLALKKLEHIDIAALITSTPSKITLRKRNRYRKKPNLKNSFLEFDDLLTSCDDKNRKSVSFELKDLLNTRESSQFRPQTSTCAMQSNNSLINLENEAIQHSDNRSKEVAAQENVEFDNNFIVFTENQERDLIQENLEIAQEVEIVEESHTQNEIQSINDRYINLKNFFEDFPNFTSTPVNIESYQEEIANYSQEIPNQNIEVMEDVLRKSLRAPSPPPETDVSSLIESSRRASEQYTAETEGESIIIVLSSEADGSFINQETSPLPGNQMTLNFNPEMNYGTQFFEFPRICHEEIVTSSDQNQIEEYFVVDSGSKICEYSEASSQYNLSTVVGSVSELIETSQIQQINQQNPTVAENWEFSRISSEGIFNIQNPEIISSLPSLESPEVFIIPESPSLPPTIKHEESPMTQIPTTILNPPSSQEILINIIEDLQNKTNLKKIVYLKKELDLGADFERQWRIHKKRFIEEFVKDQVVVPRYIHSAIKFTDPTYFKFSLLRDIQMYHDSVQMENIKKSVEDNMPFAQSSSLVSSTTTQQTNPENSVNIKEEQLTQSSRSNSDEVLFVERPLDMPMLISDDENDAESSEEITNSKLMTSADPFLAALEKMHQPMINDPVTQFSDGNRSEKSADNNLLNQGFSVRSDSAVATTKFVEKKEDQIIGDAEIVEKSPETVTKFTVESTKLSEIYKAENSLHIIDGLQQVEDENHENITAEPEEIIRTIHNSDSVKEMTTKSKKMSPEFRRLITEAGNSTSRKIRKCCFHSNIKLNLRSAKARSSSMKLRSSHQQKTGKYHISSTTIAGKIKRKKSKKSLHSRRATRTSLKNPQKLEDSSGSKKMLKTASSDLKIEDNPTNSNSLANLKFCDSDFKDPSNVSDFLNCKVLLENDSRAERALANSENLESLEIPSDFRRSVNSTTSSDFKAGKISIITRNLRKRKNATNFARFPDPKTLLSDCESATNSKSIKKFQDPSSNIQILDCKVVLESNLRAEKVPANSQDSKNHVNSSNFSRSLDSNTSLLDSNLRSDKMKSDINRTRSKISTRLNESFENLRKLIPAPTQNTKKRLLSIDSNGKELCNLNIKQNLRNSAFQTKICVICKFRRVIFKKFLSQFQLFVDLPEYNLFSVCVRDAESIGKLLSLNKKDFIDLLNILKLIGDYELTKFDKNLQYTLERVQELSIYEAKSIVDLFFNTIPNLKPFYFRLVDGFLICVGDKWSVPDVVEFVEPEILDSIRKS